MDESGSGGMSLKTTRRQDRSKRMHLLHTLVRPFRPHLVTPGKKLPAGSPQLQPLKKIYKWCNVQERRVSDTYMYDITSKSTQKSDAGRKRRIYYFSGGGWQMPPSSQHWRLCAELAIKTPNSIVTVVSYPLAPGSPAAALRPHLTRWYDEALALSRQNEEHVTFAGDSSGGNLVLCLVMHQLQADLQKPRPDVLLVISPACDLQQKPRGSVPVEKNDPILTVDYINSTARTYAAESDPATAWISPNKADPSVLARSGITLYGITGGWDVLTPDALLFRDRCHEVGVQGEWLEWDRQMHCFPLAWFYGLPDSVKGKDWIVDMLKKSQ